MRISNHLITVVVNSMGSRFSEVIKVRPVIFLIKASLHPIMMSIRPAELPIQVVFVSPRPLLAPGGNVQHAVVSCCALLL